MKRRKRVGDSTDPCGTLLLIALGEEQWPSTTAAIKRLEKNSAIKAQREGQNPNEES